VYGNAVINWTPLYNGQNTLQFKNNIYWTSCFMGPLSTTTTMTVNVLKCHPQFAEDTNGNIARLAPNIIDVFLDQSTMSGATSALDDAIANLNANQAATGVTFQRVGTPCPQPYSGRCVSVEIDTDPNARCGRTSGGSVDSTGYYAGALRIYVRSDWEAYAPSGLRRTFVHELQHYMGLADYTSAGSCSTSDAARDDFQCKQTTTLTTLTINDYLPVLRTAYGPDARSTCGW
jgi:hypothetical protein